MYDNFFYDQICTIYRPTTTIVNGAQKDTKTAIYSDVGCALWGLKFGNLRDTAGSRLTDQATHNMNLDGIYEVMIGDIIMIGNREYIVTDCISYTDIDNSIDNTSLTVRIR